jgi:hypothetical protein
VAEIPERLRTNGRAADPVFEGAEKLFRRYLREHLVNGQFSNAGFRLSRPNSVNREKYSLVEDVLLSLDDRHVGSGVWSLRVEDLPAEFPPEKPQISVFPQHLPVDENYAHSEIWCDRIERTGQHVEPNNETKKLLRAILSQRVHIEIAATK